VTFQPDDEVWLLTLDQIESHTGVVFRRLRRTARSIGNSTFTFDTGHVLYSKLRPYLNKVVCPDEPGIATTELIPLRPRPTILDRGYLAYYLRSPMFLAYASQYVAGAKMPRVIADRFWEHEIPLPPLSEQRRIVEILDQADRLRRLRAEADVKADRVLPALFIEMFGDPATNPKGLPSASFGDLIADGPQNGLYRPASDYGSGTPILRIDSFYAGRVTRLADLRRLRVSPAELETYGLRERDIVINRVNSEEFLGKSAIVPALAEPTVFESNMMRLRVDEARVIPEYVIQHLQTASTRREMLRKAKRAINQASINQTDVRGLTILLPALEAQKRFAALAREIQMCVGMGGITRDRIEAIFQLGMRRAFTGELTSAWREAHTDQLADEMEQLARVLRSPCKEANR
jgi:type I restriction enzyme S subunit